MSKEKVYRALAEQQGAFLSGEELSRRIGISRAAVWKAVETLRKSGCDIEARTGLGYCLRELGDHLGEREIGAALGCERPHWQAVEEVDSTNSLCKRLGMDGAPDGTAVIAECQSAGRGRQGRSFQSPAGMGVYCSILWRPQVSPEALMNLPALGAIAVRRAIEEVTGVAIDIKWPNDLVLHGKKLGGILTELALEGESGAVDYVVLGIGINVHEKQEDFEGEVADIASSLDVELGRSVSRPALAAALLRQLDVLRREALETPVRWLSDYRESCLTIGKEVQVLRGDQRRRAVALGVDDRFGLRVRYADGTEDTVRSGEVSVRGLYGYVPE